MELNAERALLILMKCAIGIIRIILNLNFYLKAVFIIVLINTVFIGKAALDQHWVNRINRLKGSTLKLLAVDQNKVLVIQTGYDIKTVEHIVYNGLVCTVSSLEKLPGQCDFYGARGQSDIVVLRKVNRKMSRYVSCTLRMEYKRIPHVCHIAAG